MVKKVEDTKVYKLRWFPEEFGTTRILVWATIFLAFMGALSYLTDIEYNFVIAWAALFGGLGGITSWVRKNDSMRKNDTAKLSDLRQERLSVIASEILEKTYHVHRSIQIIANPFSLPDEIYTIHNEKETKEDEHEHPKVSQAEIFAYRYNKYNKLFSEYCSLDIKAKVYFSETVAGHVDEMKSIISFINRSISRLFRYSREDSKRKDDEKATRTEEEIWAFFYPDSYEETFPDGTARTIFKKHIEIFASICEQLDSELGDHIRG